MTTTEEKDSVCCPPFDPVPWDDKEIQWSGKLFLKDHVCTLFYMPLNFGSKMKRLDAKIRNSQATVPDYLCLSDHTSRWNMDIYLSVDKEIPGENHVSLTGKFYSRVYEGSFRDTGKWMTDYKEKAKGRGYKASKYYMWYTTCPKCAKKYGKNYVVILSRIE